MEERDKLFPGALRWCDLNNSRYITRKPIYDFLVNEASNLTGRILDFGCGSMQYKSLFKGADEYIGLDIEGAETNGFLAENVVYYNGKDIPFEMESMDSIIAVEVLEHVEELESILKQLSKILKKDGKFIFTVPMIFPLHLEPWDYRRFTIYGIKNMLEKCGFEEINISASTSAKDTIRRLKIIENSRKTGWFQSKWNKMYILYANICFCFGKRDVKESKLPIGYLVTCKK